MAQLLRYCVTAKKNSLENLLGLGQILRDDGPSPWLTTLTNGMSKVSETSTSRKAL